MDPPNPPEENVLYTINEEEEEINSDDVEQFVDTVFIDAEESEESCRDNGNGIIDIFEKENDPTPSPNLPNQDDQSSTDTFPYLDSWDKVKFLLHPRLNHESLSSFASSSGQGSPGSSKKSTNQVLNTASTQSSVLNWEKRNKGKSVRFDSSTRLPSIKDEYEIKVEAKSVDEILREIATGKWSNRSLIMDEEIDGTKILESRTCSNASCVKEAERQRRKVLNEDEVENGNVVFEDGHLPSFHSLLNMLNDNRNYRWDVKTFQNGPPRSEGEFLELWRACRRNPTAFGIKVSQPQELPDREELIKEARSKAKMKAEKIKSKSLKELARFPLGVPSRELYNSDGKNSIKPEDQVKLKARYDELRDLYPHLPPLRPLDYKNSPTTVRLRLKQAEDWHRLVSLNSKPESSRRLVRSINRNNIADQNNVDNLDDDASLPELSEPKKIPGYAATTTSFLYKIKNQTKLNTSMSEGR